jgi:hypothetical protein
MTVVVFWVMTRIVLWSPTFRRNISRHNTQGHNRHMLITRSQMTTFPQNSDPDEHQGTIMDIWWYNKYLFDILNS